MTINTKDEKKHTPGPWTVLNGSSGLLIEQRVRLVDFDNGVRPLHVAFIATSLTPSPRAEADARLIAAAPDLLEALKDLVECDCAAYELDAANCEHARA